MARFFISYRRGDTGAYADRVVARLSAFQFSTVFEDREQIRLADNYADRIRDALAECDAVLVLIGGTWATAQDESGRRRLDDSADWVRREVALAFELRKHVVPVLFDGARLPEAGSLPPDLASLATAQGYEINGNYFQRDVDDLARRLERDLIATARQPLVSTPSSGSIVRQLQLTWIGLSLLTVVFAVVPFFASPVPRLFWLFPMAMTLATFVWWLYWLGESLRSTRPRFT